tara:strand:+ start:452 stop:667 length:216 start_codon:yes stop_codon:yes gene_type:complete
MKYRLANENHKTTSELDTLYVTCRKAVNDEGAVIVNRHFDLIAFWSSWTNKVCPGFGATDSEREAIIDYRL